MDKKITGVLIAGILVAICLFFLVDIYLAGIVLILTVVLVMSLMIMQDSTFLPQINVRLREDAKAVILTNAGNSPALKIHVALVPLDIEYDVPSLAADASHEYPLSSMLAEVKAVITFENEKGLPFSLTHRLSASEEYDPLKPMIPVFKWK
jgi:hypothetical protein